MTTPNNEPIPENVRAYFRKQGRKGGLKLKREKPSNYYRTVGKKGGRPAQYRPCTAGKHHRWNPRTKKCYRCGKSQAALRKD